MKKLLFIIILIIQTALLYSQKVEWASKVVNYSSQLDKIVCSAKQILGKPNVLPNGGESQFAWSVALDQSGEEKAGESSITVSFRKAIKTRQIAIAESFNPGSVVKIILIDSKNKQTKVYEAEPDTTLHSPRMFNIYIPLTEYEVKSIKLITRPDKVQGMNQIDAVGISSDEDTVKAVIHCIDEADFFSEPENLGQNINSPLNETQPIISPDSKTLFFVRENSPDKYGVTNRNILISTLNADNTWSFARNLGGVLSNKGENGYSVMHDGKSLLLGNVYNRDGSITNGLSISQKEESGWTYPEKITIKNFYTSNPNSTFFMSNDNKILLLSLERKNGYGGLDIYVCHLTDINTYSEPVNLGPEVNTVADDCSPFLAADNMTLYYSTSGFSGFGSNDIYMTRRLGSNWTRWIEPVNLGPKINTPDWDAYYTIPSSGEYAYFVSYKNAIGEGDIFRIELPRIAKPKPVMNITGRITDSTTGNPLVCRLYPFLTSEDRKLDEVTTDKNGDFKLLLPSTYKYELKIIADGYIEHTEEIDLTNINETYEILKDIYLSKKKHEILADNLEKKKTGKKLADRTKTAKEIAQTVNRENNLKTEEKVAEITNQDTVSITEDYSERIPTGKPIVEERKSKSKTIKLKEKNIAKRGKPDSISISKDLNTIFKYQPPKTDKNIIASIFFESNERELNNNAKLLLDSAALTVLSYPDGIIEVAGSADPRGAFSYNVKISIARARNVLEYLLSKGCNPKRLLLKGYSNLFPLYPNSSSESQALNRRVDIILLKKKRFE